MALRDLWDDEYLRLRVMLIGMMAVFIVLAAAIWKIQVAEGKDYQRDLMKQSVRRVRIPGMRGRIFDRQGVRLADNRPSYCIAVYLEELRQPGRWPKTIAAVEKQLDELSQIIGVPRRLTREDIQMHIGKRLPLPLLAWKDLDDVAMARLAEKTLLTPGVEVSTEAVRVYPQGKAACHVLGYVGRAEIDKNEEDEPYHYYLPEMAGKSGVERRFDDLLKGEAGGRLVRVDVAGFRHDDLGVREPKNGNDLRLSIDIRVQKLAEEALSGVRGVAVVVDPQNGDVLAMASSPGYDPNLFIPRISAGDWATLTGDPSKPLINRAAAGAYAPGSIFKPVVAMSALENGKSTAQQAYNCPGHFELGRARFRCWFTPGHGVVNLQQALKHSCNVYFFHLGLQTGADAIYHMSQALGLGQKTGIGLDYEVAGTLPNDAWKRRTQNDGWRDGDTCNLSIGQGFLTVTPLQMAMVTATLANGGTLYRPRLLLETIGANGLATQRIAPQAANDLHWNPAHIRVVRNGMLDVVQGERGTGRYAAIPNVQVAGKTGTAEYGRKEEGKKLGWMIVFAPFEQPRYAIAMMVEDAVSGGTTVAPLMKKVLSGLFEDAASAGKGEG
ncbi:MAG TPA: penicillin-binding protein 2 [Verrucomicrobia bacterium]|nr:MAG: penicillin-binding protein 2 [Lentisphaerae bacterium GWF2_57_35]HBA85406.1 penicillin-binding protein 2 [Verrucomicrobiota bacterium]